MSKKLYIVFGGIGALVCLASVLHSVFVGTELCTSSSCHVVSHFSKLNGFYMSLLGFLYFSAVSLVGFLTEMHGFSHEPLQRLSEFFKRNERLFGWFVFSGLLFEAVLLGRQFFDLNVVCKFCFAVAVLTLLTGFSYAYEKKRPEMAVLFAVVMFAMWLTPMNLSTPFESAFPLLDDKGVRNEMVLIYSPDCPHCHEVMSWCRKRGLNLLLCPKDKALAFLKVNGIKFVPALFVKENSQMMLLSGKNRILSFLNERNSGNTLEELTGTLPSLFPQLETADFGKTAGGGCSLEENSCGE